MSGRSSLGLLAAPRAAAAWPRRQTATAMIGLGIGPRDGAYPAARLFRRPLAGDGSRSAAQLDVMGRAGVPYRVPWTARDEAKKRALRVANVNRGRGPKSFTVTGASSYAPIPDAAPAPGGLTGAISRIASAVAGPLQGRDRGAGCSNCG